MPIVPADGSLRVLQSFPAPRPTTNPYLVLLSDALKHSGVTVVNFTWRAALTRRFDVFHAHWPEILVEGRTPLRRIARQILFLLLVFKLRVSRTAIVRTVHNVERPHGLGWRETLLLDVFDKRTTLRIRLNATTPIPAGQTFVTIPHGHYRDWFADYPRKDVVRAQLGFVGLIRRYKGVELLLKAFGPASEQEPDLTLRIGGNPTSDELREVVESYVHTDSRIRATLGYVTDAELVDIVTSSELVVLPYRFMHNSGGALTALSLDRPVLVPLNEVNEKLAEEVGREWIQFFSGELTTDQLVEAFRRSALIPAGARPDLAARDWDRAGIEHVRAYREAVELTKRRKRAR